MEALLHPTPATMPQSAPPETEAQRLEAERLMTRERIAGYERELAAEQKNLTRIERALSRAIGQ